MSKSANAFAIQSCMQRVVNFRILAAAALAAAIPVFARAQSQSTLPREIDRSLSWCAAPAANPQWARQPIYLVLEEETAAEVGHASRLPLTHLAELLAATRSQLRLFPGAYEPANHGGVPQAPAEPHYRVQALWGDIAFQFRGDGTVDSIVMRDVRDSTLLGQVAAALRAAAKPGALTPFGTNAQVRRMTLKPEMSASKTGAAWGMFTMEVPVERPVTIVKRAPLGYPSELRRFKADITLQFYVDTTGKAEPKTIVTVPAPDSIKWPDEATRMAYRQFVNVSRRAVERSQFAPAEFLGCRYRRLVRQPLAFDVMPPP